MSEHAPQGEPFTFCLACGRAFAWRGVTLVQRCVKCWSYNDARDQSKSAQA